MTLKGRRFSSSSEVIENATVELNKLRKIDFELEFQQLFSRCKKIQKMIVKSLQPCHVMSTCLEGSKFVLDFHSSWRRYKIKPPSLDLEIVSFLDGLQTYLRSIIYSGTEGFSSKQLLVLFLMKDSDMN
ncbi:hypothetical protein LAZ67_12002736 [Cordylochernes scorpioides]|uniref:Uncharacterized protein n=1 Tax=Cordylochernes scorpioides TaxID=51811 RepID=A0ABY6L206_9ARAC|nr:hypothetical protein LAZ67_12002736 [Cordylochernes scorpioides]